MFWTCDTPEFTTATALVAEAIQAYKEAHDIPTWEDSLIQIAEPGDELWTQWQADSGSRMQGDPAHSEIALQVEGYGQFYGCVEAAIADLPRYFMAEEPLEPEPLWSPEEGYGNPYPAIDDPH